MNKNISKPVLSISLLASNRPDTIRKCLDSLRPIMEAIPSELILVDTSNSPEIHEILLEYTDKVYEFEWCRDFAKARNVGLHKARGEWFMFLDDDEWFVDTDDLIQFFQSGEYRDYGFAYYQIRNFFEPKYISYSDGMVCRLYKLEKGCAFHSKIHEYFAPVQGKRRYLTSMIYHSGYMYITQEQKRAHFERNTSLLLDMIQEEPGRQRWKTQLAQEYCAMNEWERLEAFCKAELDKLNQLKKLSESEDIRMFATLCSGYVHALCGQTKYEEAKCFCQDKIKDERSIDYLKALLQYVKAEIHFELQEWKQAEHHIRAYLKLEDILNQENSPYEYQKLVLLVGVAFDESRIAEAYSMLIASTLAQGHMEELLRYYELLEWNQQNIHVHSNLEQHIVDAMAKLEYDPIFTRIATDAFRNRGLSLYMIYAANRWEEEEEAFRKIMYVYSKVDVADAYIMYARICMADWEQDREKVMELLPDYYQALGNVFQIPKRLCQIAEKYEIDLQQYWTVIEPDKWKSSVTRHLSYTEELDEVNLHMQRVFVPGDWKYRFYYVALLEREARQGMEDESEPDHAKIEEWVYAVFDFYSDYYREDAESDQNLEALYSHMVKAMEDINVEMGDASYDDLVVRLHGFTVAVLEYYLALYKDAAFEGEMELLEPEVRAAVWLNEYFGKEESDWEGRVAALRACARCYPAFGEKIKLLVKQVGEQKVEHEAAKAKRASDELEQMVAVMKDRIRQMAEQGLKQEALAVLAQVRALAPQDQELIQMEMEL